MKRMTRPTRLHAVDGTYAIKPLDEAIRDYLRDVATDPDEEWDEITATETPIALAAEAYPRKRSGVYARSHTESKILDVMHAKRKCSGDDTCAEENG
jgi:hypothetical protein